MDKKRTVSVEKPMVYITIAYLFIITVIYPFYFEKGYINMGEAKWHFYKVFTFSFIVIMTILYMFYEDKKRSKNSVTDNMVISYAVICVISFIFSSYKEYTMWGIGGWYMGLISQLWFVFTYLYVSRFYRHNKWLVVGCLTSSFGVFVIGIIQRFMILDPFGLLSGIVSSLYDEYISTIGQSSWFSSYLVVIAPIGFYCYWNCDDIKKRILAGIYTLIASVMFIVQNSDCAILALGAIMLVFFLLSFDSMKHMLRFTQILMIMFGSWSLTGFLQEKLLYKTVEFSGIMIKVSESRYTLAAFVGTVLFYIILRLVSKNKRFDISVLSIVPKVIVAAVFICSLLLVLYVGMNSAGKLSGTVLESSNNYLRVDENWGNRRGVSWIISFKTYGLMGLKDKLIGVGPDGFYNIVYRFFANEMNEVWGNDKILTCAHNEWLTMLINVGLIGAILYIGVFISSLLRFVKLYKNDMRLIAIIAALIGYMVHNTFCYQQVICTPLIFILLGIGENMVRDL
ncbi:MAG: O-antigen ligase family protein [Lachnospiraceae bacterium]|nr:O-antigen ligase family protein [Lachnospiraceae bacterium]